MGHDLSAWVCHQGELCTVVLLIQKELCQLPTSPNTERSDLQFLQVLKLTGGTHWAPHQLFLPRDLWHGLIGAQTLDTLETSRKIPCTMQLGESRLLEADSAGHTAESLLSKSPREPQDTVLNAFSARWPPGWEAYRNIPLFIYKSHSVLPHL